MAEASGQGPLPTGRGLGLRSHLYMLVAAALLPILGIGLLTVSQGASRLREDSSHRLLDTASLLAHAVDRSIEEHVASLRMLQEATAGDPGRATALWNRNRNSGLDTRIIRAGGDGAERVPAGLLEAARASGLPQVSPLFFLPDAPATPLVAIAVPPAGEAGDGAAVVLRSNNLIDAVSIAAASQSLLVAVVDSTGRIAARSRSPERFLGQPVPHWERLKALGTRSGVFEATTKEGGEVMFAFQKLDAAPGWALVVGEPLPAFEARWRGPLMGIGLGALVAASLGLLASHVLANRILRPVRRLARRARLVADGHDDSGLEPVVDPQSTVREFATLQEGLASAEAALRRRADDARALAASLDRSQRIYRTVAEAGALVFWQARTDGTIASCTGWPELTGLPESQGLGRGWLQAVHPDDLPALNQAWSHVIVNQRPFDFEFRVRDARGQWRWVRSRGDRITAADGGGWAGVLEDVDARRQAQAHIVYLAQHDPLTGLANRGVLMERLAAAAAAGRHGRLSALLCLDLDRFKEVNDTLGHPSGDALLRTVAARLRAVVREGDLVARLGGDEFAVLLEALAAPEDAAELAQRMIEAVQAPYDLDGQRAVVGTSVGIALTGADAGSAERLLQNADLALYQVKHQGRGHYRFFEPGMDRRMQARRRLEMELRDAIAAEQFEIHYQPRVGLHDRRLRGFEALLRWRHPGRGLQKPEQFLPMLEEAGLIDQVERWVVREAARQALRWPPHLRLSINLAASQLNPRLHEWLLEELATAHLAPGRLELEISEQALVAGFNAASASLLRLKEAGVAITIDHFGGTGASSLGCLRSFPFDRVKIDRSFMAEAGTAPHGSTVVSAISHLCSQLGITTVIEGVEREEQLQLLGSGAADEAQGFLFAPPLDAEAARELAAAAEQAPPAPA